MLLEPVAVSDMANIACSPEWHFICTNRFSIAHVLVSGVEMSSILTHFNKKYKVLSSKKQKSGKNYFFVCLFCSVEL